MEALYILLCVGIGLLVVTALVVGAVKLLGSPGSALSDGQRQQRGAELSEKIVATSRDLSKLDPDTRQVIHRLLRLLSGHPDPERAIRQAQVALGPVGREVPEAVAETDLSEPAAAAIEA